MSLIARFLDPKNDFAFKQVFGTEKHKDILMHFLSENDALSMLRQAGCCRLSKSA